MCVLNPAFSGRLSWTKAGTVLPRWKAQPVLWSHGSAEAGADSSPQYAAGKEILSGFLYLHQSLHSIFPIKYVCMDYDFKNIRKTMTSSLILHVSWCHGDSQIKYVLELYVHLEVISLPVSCLIPAALQQTHSLGRQLPSPPELDWMDYKY